MDKLFGFEWVPSIHGPEGCADTRRVDGFFERNGIDDPKEHDEGSPGALALADEARNWFADRKKTGHPLVVARGFFGQPIWACCEPTIRQLSRALDLILEDARANSPDEEVEPQEGPHPLPHDERQTPDPAGEHSGTDVVKALGEDLDETTAAERRTPVERPHSDDIEQMLAADEQEAARRRKELIDGTVMD